MGILFGDTDVYNKSVEKTQSSISQISNQKCMNICQNNNSSVLMITGVDTNSINDIQKCNVSGASCILKSALSASITSKQSSKQKTSLGFLPSFSDTNVSNDNYQSISSNTSQFVNETCGNRSENSSTGVILIKDVRANNINVGQFGFAGHSGCVLSNISRAVTNTSQENDQSTTKGSLGGIIGIILTVLFVGGFIWLFMHMHKSHSIATTAPEVTNVSDVTEIVGENVTDRGENKTDQFDTVKYKNHIEGFGTGVYIVLFFSLVSLGTSVFFFIDSHNAKKECYGRVSNGAPRPTSTNQIPGQSCSEEVDSAECYVPLLPNGSRAYNPYE